LRWPSPLDNTPAMTTTHASASSSAAAQTNQPTLRDYAVVTTLLAIYAALLALAVRSASGAELDKEQLIAPMAAMFALTALVWLLMVLFRNYATLRGLASADYYRTYSVAAPADWIERPARTFNNLMQVPTLFYVGCLAMMFTGRFDNAQLSLAWIYVATRTVHALLYMVWNPLSYRFGSWAASCICLGTLWARFVL
jgi:hypothetical protein